MHLRSLIFVTQQNFTAHSVSQVTRRDNIEMHHRPSKQWFTQLLLTALISLPLPGNASDPLNTKEPPQALPTVTFNIPRQAADDALPVFGQQANVTVIYPFNKVKDHQTNALQGVYSVPHAVAVLLANTGLKGDFGAEGHLVITQVDLSKGKSMNITTKKSLLATMVGLFTATGAVQQAYGQDGEAATAQGRMEEIIVTATKRETSLQDTPLSISAFTEADMGRQGIENFEDFSRQTPGLILSGVKNFNKFTIRGVQTSSTTSSNGEQKSVAVYIDEVPVSTFSVVTPDLRLYDVERVEVLRGPQGTAFGSGSMAGGIRIITNKANLSGFDSSVRLDAGGTTGGGVRQRYSGMVNVPLIDDQLALRMVGYVRDEEGYVDNLGAWDYAGKENDGSSEEWGVRASLRWQPVDNFLATLSVMHDDIEAGSFDLVNPMLGKNKRISFFLDTTLVETTNINATFEYTLDWAILTSSTTYALSDSDWDLDADAILTGVLPFGYSELQEQAALVQELRLVSTTDSKIDWLVGLFYLDRETDFTGGGLTSQQFLDQQGIDASNLGYFQGPGVNTGSAIKVLENTEAAVFGELTYSFTDTLSLTGGLRYTTFEYTDTLTDRGFVSDIIPLVFGGVGGVAVSAPDSALSETTGNQSATTARLSLNWQPSDDHMYYALAAEGFRRPHPNLIASLPNTVDPSDPTIIPRVAESDSLWNYEIGAKTQWMDGRLQANIAAYFIVWDDIQLSATRGSDATPYTVNAGDAETKGLEAEFLLWPSANLQLGLNLTLAKSEIVSLSDADAVISGGVEGAPLASPEVKISGFGQYIWPLNNGDQVYARVDLQYIDKYPNALPNIAGSATQDPNPNFSYTDSYENINAQVGWETDELSIVLYGENVLDNDDFIYINPAVHSFNRYSTLRPRTIGLRVDWKY